MTPIPVPYSTTALSESARRRALGLPPRQPSRNRMQRHQLTAAQINLALWLILAVAVAVPAVAAAVMLWLR